MHWLIIGKTMKWSKIIDSLDGSVTGKLNWMMCDPLPDFYCSVKGNQFTKQNLRLRVNLENLAEFGHILDRVKSSTA